MTLILEDIGSKFRSSWNGSAIDRRKAFETFVKENIRFNSKSVFRRLTPDDVVNGFALRPQPSDYHFPYMAVVSKNRTDKPINFIIEVEVSEDTTKFVFSSQSVKKEDFNEKESPFRRGIDLEFVFDKFDRHESRINIISAFPSHNIDTGAFALDFSLRFSSSFKPDSTRLSDAAAFGCISKFGVDLVDLKTVFLLKNGHSWYATRGFVPDVDSFFPKSLLGENAKEISLRLGKVSLGDIKKHCQDFLSQINNVFAKIVESQTRNGKAPSITKARLPKAAFLSDENKPDEKFNQSNASNGLVLSLRPVYNPYHEETALFAPPQVDIFDIEKQARNLTEIIDQVLEKQYQGRDLKLSEFLGRVGDECVLQSEFISNFENLRYMYFVSDANGDTQPIPKLCELVDSFRKVAESHSKMVIRNPWDSLFGNDTTTRNGVKPEPKRRASLRPRSPKSTSRKAK